MGIGTGTCGFPSRAMVFMQIVVAIRSQVQFMSRAESDTSDLIGFFSHASKWMMALLPESRKSPFIMNVPFPAFSSTRMSTCQRFMMWILIVTRNLPSSFQLKEFKSEQLGTAPH